MEETSNAERDLVEDWLARSDKNVLSRRPTGFLHSTPIVASQLMPIEGSHSTPLGKHRSKPSKPVKFLHSTPVDERLSTNVDISFILEESDDSTVTHDLDVSNIASELNKAILEYVAQDARLLLCHKVSTWEKLDKEKRTFAEKTLTNAELRDYFVKLMLPNIFEIVEASQYTKIFDILKFNEHFQRINRGFIFKSAIKYEKPLIFHVDYRLLHKINIDEELEELVKANDYEDEEDEEFAQPRKKFNFETQKPNPMPSNLFVVIGAGATPTQAQPQRKRLALATHALISMIVKRNYEYYNCSLIDYDEILKRWHRSRDRFMQTGYPTICTDAEKLKRNVTIYQLIREAVLRMMNKRF